MSLGILFWLLLGSEPAHARTENLSTPVFCIVGSGYRFYAPGMQRWLTGDPQLAHNLNNTLAVTPIGLPKKCNALNQACNIVKPCKGRLGSSSTRQLNSEIAGKLEQNGWEITGGGGQRPETFLPGAGPGTRGGNFTDITAVRDGQILHVNTVNTLADGGNTYSAGGRCCSNHTDKARPEREIDFDPKKTLKYYVIKTNSFVCNSTRYRTDNQNY